MISGLTSQTATYTPPKVERLIVYNPDFGPYEENEMEKIIFYYPESYDKNVQMSDIGLSEALTNITKTFTTSPCEIMRTDKCRWAFLNPESHYWIVLIVNYGYIRDKSDEIEYQENTLNDMGLSAMLKKIYMNFKLFNGSFESIVQRSSIQHLKDIAKEHLTDTVKSLNALDANLFGTLDGLLFLPVNKNIYLQIQSSINTLEMTFSQIRSTMMMYKDYLVWSGLEQNDTKLIYKFWVDKYSNNINPNGGCYFIVGPKDLGDEDAIITKKDIYTEPECVRSSMVVCHGNDFTFFYFIDPAYTEDIHFYRHLHEHTSNHINSLSASISHPKPSGEEEYNYIYFNHMNLALKSTFKSRGFEISTDIMNILQQLHQDFEKSEERISEILIRPYGDLWIVGKKSDSRNLYVIIEKKNSNIVIINDEVKRLCKNQFQNIFMD